MVKLSVNIDGFAVLRKISGTPDLIEVAQLLVKNGVKAVSTRWHNEGWHLEAKELAEIKRHAKVSLWAHAPVSAAGAVAAKAVFGAVCLEDEKAGQKSGSLDLSRAEVERDLVGAIGLLKKKEIGVFLLLDSQAQAIRKAKKMGVQGVVLSGRRYCECARSRRQEVLEDLHVAGRLAQELGLELQVGQDLESRHAKALADISGLSFLNLGSSVAGHSAFKGLTDVFEEIQESIHGNDPMVAFAALKALG